MVSSTSGSADERLDQAGAQRYARAWARAVARLGFLPVSRAEAERLLLTQTVALADAVLAEPFTAEPGHQVGQALVAAHLTDPAILDWSVRALHREFLPSVLPQAPPTAVPRVAELQGALAAGFARALRDQTLIQQDRISRSAWAARDLAEQALRDSEARFRAIFAGAAIGIGIVDLDGRMIDANRAFAEILGYSPAEVRRLNVAELFEDPTGMCELHAELVQGLRDGVRLTRPCRRKDGTAIWADLSMSLIRHDDGRPRFTTIMVQDITDRHELQERLRFQALHDPLTGLPNRTHFYERLKETFDAAAPGRRVAVCFLDLDGFKEINYRYGHAVGDRLLDVIGRRLVDRVSDRGHLVARMGGDSFVMLIADSPSESEAVALAQEMLSVVAQPVRIDDYQISITASVGVVVRPTAESDPADVMKAADTTVSWAKADGRGRWAVYDPVRNAEEKTRLELTAALPLGLDRDEFVIDYQPIVSLADGQVQAVEALVRWQHPLLGRLAPNHFIDLAEKSGIIVQLGRWVLRRACADASRWHRDYPDRRLMVSVNLSVRQVQEPGLAAEVADALAQSGLPADLLQLELTESAVMATSGEPLRVLSELAELGVRLAVDDFGTGYSNLAYLRHLPVHTLKLAGPFVAGIRSDGPTSCVDEQIVDALVRLAHALGLCVTAEAVERAEQADRLRALGCDTGQGRYFSPPVERERIPALLDGTTVPGGAVQRGAAAIG
ncbi:MAG TPA: EAL domain-containing protein [Micromonosporaceae bacterium]